MRNEDVAAAMAAMETSFKQHSDTQLAKFTSLLEQFMTNTETRLTQLTVATKGDPTDGPVGETDTNPHHGVREDLEPRRPDLHSLLRTLRVDVPRFDGSNVDDWIYKINKFFALNRVEPEMRLAIVSFHLDGEPSTWFQWMEKSGVLTTWEIFLRELRKRFGASIYDDPLGRISKLVQKGTVSQFRAEFEELMTRISGVSEPLFLNFFIWGLKTDIRRELLIARPMSLTDAMAMAQLFEERIDDLVRTPRRDGGRSHEGPPHRSGPGPIQASPRPAVSSPSTGTPPQRGGFLPAGGTRLPVKRMSPEELREKREKGLCFSCDEKYHANHRCKNRVLLMVGAEEDDSEPEEMSATPENVSADEGPEVSLNTFSNSTNPHIF